MDNPGLRARFDRCDHDGNGKIDEKEFGEMLDGLGLGYSPAQVRAAFEGVDVNGSGLIDYDEFARWWTHH
ncbi:MAG TPA: EF-hand domain-containing protein [Polyangiaceae bacterium]|nr:EF-hand domain-containing protein [Polyangiaceae bacterium]